MLEISGKKFLPSPFAYYILLFSHLPKAWHGKCTNNVNRIRADYSVIRWEIIFNVLKDTGSFIYNSPSYKYGQDYFSSYF